jgi:uncharacterized membrane protein SpoIIM required for sporulation
VTPVPAQPSGSRRDREWTRLRELLARVEASGLGALGDDELWELPSLYRRTLSDLSLLRSSGAPPHLLSDLGQLCNRAHGVIYRGTLQRRRGRVLAFVTAELPRSVRRQAGYIWAAAGVLVLFGVIGYFSCLFNADLAESVLGAFRPDMLREWQTTLETADRQEQLRLAAQIEEQERSFAAVAITFNNIKVGVTAFVTGIAGGLPTIIALAFNGFLLGAVAFLYFVTPPGFEINLGLYFLAGVAPHGSIELPAICLAGAAGMLLGFSWLFPWQRARGEALRQAAREAGRLVAACALTLVVAGLIEGFITPLPPPPVVPADLWFWAKIIFGVCIFVLWLLWLLSGGRADRRELGLGK